VVRAVRINALRTADGLRDLLALIESGARPDALMVPKTETAEELAILEEILGERLATVCFIAIIETARGLAAVERIASATPRLRAMVFGAADYSANLGTDMGWEQMRYARGRIVVAGVAASVATIDSPCFEFADPATLREEIARARGMGFTGKCAVHPRQVAEIVDGFTPADSAVDRALRILAATDASRGQICLLDGQMIGPPAVLAARRLLERAGKLPRLAAGFVKS
jgi:citrate lyase beta subunit